MLILRKPYKTFFLGKPLCWFCLTSCSCWKMKLFYYMLHVSSEKFNTKLIFLMVFQTFNDVTNQFVNNCFIFLILVWIPTIILSPGLCEWGNDQILSSIHGLFPIFSYHEVQPSEIKNWHGHVPWTQGFQDFLIWINFFFS